MPSVVLNDKLRKGLPDDARKYIDSLEKRVRDTNTESKERKEELRLLKEAQAAEQKKIEEQRRAEKEATNKALREQGKFKPLYEEAQKEVADLRAELELKKQRGDVYENVLMKSVETRRAKLPEEWKKIVPNVSPDEQLAWLDKWQDRLTRPVPPSLNADPKLAGAPQARRLTDVQKDVAKAAGMTEEAYLKRLIEMEA